MIPIGLVLFFVFAGFVIGVTCPWRLHEWLRKEKLPIAKGRTLDMLALTYGCSRRVETDEELRARIGRIVSTPNLSESREKADRISIEYIADLEARIDRLTKLEDKFPKNLSKCRRCGRVCERCDGSAVPE